MALKCEGWISALGNPYPIFKSRTNTPQTLPMYSIIWLISCLILRTALRNVSTVLLHLIFKLYIVGLIIYNLYVSKPGFSAEVLSDYSTKSFSIAFLICDQMFCFLIHLSSSKDGKFLEGRRLVCFVHFFARAQISACCIFVICCSIFICWINEWMDA